MVSHRIATVQLHPKPHQIERNFERASELVRDAASKGATLVVLPEYHLQGWDPEDAQFREQAKLYKTYLDKYRSLAKELHISIVPGTLIEYHKSSDSGDIIELRNVAYFINGNGDILGSYQKKNLWDTERNYLTSSKHDFHKVIDTEFGKVGMLICWDLGWPEAFRELIRQGAKIIIMPAFWMGAHSSPKGLKRNPDFEKTFLQSLINARCLEGTCAVVFCNAGGPKKAEGVKSNGYIGLSQVAAPFVGPIARLEDEEDVLVADLDAEILEEAEQNYQVRADLSGDDWYYKYREVVRT